MKTFSFIVLVIVITVYITVVSRNYKECLSMNFTERYCVTTHFFK